VPEEKTRKLAVIRVRGRTGANYKVKDTMQMLNLTRANHCVIVEGNKETKGMIQKCKDYVTWGELSKDALSEMIKKRGLLVGNKRVSDAHLKASGFKSFDELAEKLLKGEAKTSSVKDMKPVFRLHPPKKGYKGGVKQAFPRGALGNRGLAINDLIKKMI